jgi:transposase
MAKYSFEFKYKVVKAYLNGEGGARYLAKKYGIPAHETIQKWVNAYKNFGEKGLYRSRKQTKYTSEFKRDAVKLYLTTEVSYQNLAKQLNMNNPSLLAIWVKSFRENGFEGLSNKPRGRPSTMSKKKNNSQKPKVSKGKSCLTDLEKAQAERIEELEIENAFLKELRRLRNAEFQERVNNSHESSTSSEDNSN